MHDDVVHHREQELGNGEEHILLEGALKLGRQLVPIRHDGFERLGDMNEGGHPLSSQL